MDDYFESHNENKIIIWIGQLWLNSFIASWLARTAPPKTPAQELRERHARLLEHELPFPEICRRLGLKFAFNGCGDNAAEDLYLFLGASYQETFGSAAALEKFVKIQDLLMEYLAEDATLQSVDFSRPLVPPPVSAVAVAPLKATPTQLDGNIRRSSRPSSTAPRERESLKRTVSGFSSDSSNGEDGGASLAEQSESVYHPSGAAGPSTAVNAGAGDNEAKYTVLLKEKGDTEGVTPRYHEVLERETPPVWTVTAEYNGLKGRASAKSKKQAKHMASRAVWIKLGQKG